MADDDAWRRPPSGGATGEPGTGDPVFTPPFPDSAGVPPGHPGPAPAAPTYSGPPPTVAPPPGWRPPAIVRPRPPRQIPWQDHDAIDAAEERARTLTYGVGLVAGAVILIMVCLVFGRWLL